MYYIYGCFWCNILFTLVFTKIFGNEFTLFDGPMGRAFVVTWLSRRLRRDRLAQRGNSITLSCPQDILIFFLSICAPCRCEKTSGISNCVDSQECKVWSSLGWKLPLSILQLTLFEELPLVKGLSLGVVSLKISDNAWTSWRLRWQSLRITKIYLE